jgi:NCAIR mutase (PurE)-related protein
MKVNASVDDVLDAYRAGRISREEAVSRIDILRIEAVGELARLDFGRELRCGIPEVVYAEGKPTEALVAILRRYVKAEGRSIATRVSPDQAALVKDAFRESGVAVEHHEVPGILVLRTAEAPQPTGGVVAVVTAGTADLRVAEEARVIAEEMGCRVLTAYDVGVAGIHRLFPALKDLADAHAFVVAAGREGTLPSIVAGLVDRPVIGVPVSSGYGYMGGGRAALASMLQSCSVITVVNIDAGFVAGAFAARIATMVAHHE